MNAALKVQAAVEANLRATRQFFDAHAQALEALAGQLAEAFRRGNKLLLCGNGGSACEAMHIAGEFAGRFVHDRKALPAVALTADGGVLTAVGNDYGFAHVFARQVEALGNAGDVLIALSTSGASPNVLAALKTARERQMTTALLTGERGTGQGAHADALFVVPSPVTARVQEVHLIALHLLAELVEARLFGDAA